jgi:hypothetical protein
VRQTKGKLLVRGVSQDNGEIASVTVNGQAAKIMSAHAGITDWEITLEPRGANAKKLAAHAVDRAGNTERTGHSLSLP